MPRSIITRWREFLAFAAVATMLTAPAHADEPRVEEVRQAWNACAAFMDKKSDDWVGWHRDHGNGYGDYFEFWDNDGSDQPSVLRQTYFIDGIVSVRQTSCFRMDGTLAFVFTAMTSPNVAGGPGEPELVREGRIYVDPTGFAFRVVGQVMQGGKKVADMDTNTYSLARGCQPVDMHLTLDRVRANYLHEMGDIEGRHPDYQPGLFDWCANSGG